MVKCPPMDGQGAHELVTEAWEPKKWLKGVSPETAPVTVQAKVPKVPLGTLTFAGDPIAQLDRASAYGAEGCRFKSYWGRFFLVIFLDFRSGSRFPERLRCGRRVCQVWRVGGLRCCRWRGWIRNILFPRWFPLRNSGTKPFLHFS